MFKLFLCRATRGEADTALLEYTHLRIQIHVCTYTIPVSYKDPCVSIQMKNTHHGTFKTFSAVRVTQLQRASFCFALSAGSQA